MKRNTLTYAVAAVGLVGSSAVLHGEEESNALLSSLSNVQISGYVSSAYVNVIGQNDGPTQQPSGFNSGVHDFRTGTPLDDGFNLDVVGLQFSSPLSGDGWQAGYMVDILAGPQAGGYSDSFYESGDDDFSVKQAYVNLLAPIGNGVDIKFGHFDTIVGYEVYAPADNTQYTRSYGFASEPFTHTGILAGTELNDMISVQAGVANSISGAINDRPLEGDGSIASPAVLGSVGLNFEGEQYGIFNGASAYYAVVNGSAAGGSESTHHYASVGMPLPIADTTLGFAWDYRHFTQGGYTETFGAYFDYAPTDASYSVHLRGELAKSGDGNFGGMTDATGNEKLYAITGTVNFDIFENVLTRVEVRYDHDAEGDSWGTSTDPEDDQWLIALNAIYSF